jgi:hypothetical protein
MKKYKFFIFILITLDEVIWTFVTLREAVRMTNFETVTGFRLNKDMIREEAYNAYQRYFSRVIRCWPFSVARRYVDSIVDEFNSICERYPTYLAWQFNRVFGADVTKSIGLIKEKKFGELNEYLESLKGGAR